MFCLYCGTNLPDDAIFCRSCGKQQNAPASTPATDITILPMPPLPGTSTVAGQPLVGNLLIVQGTPSTTDGPPLGEDISHSLANAAPSSSAASAPPQAASSARVALSPHTEYQHHPLSGPQAQHQPGFQTHPAHQMHIGPQHPSSTGLRLTEHLSRRAVLLGLAGATTAVIAGGTLLALSHSSPQSPSPIPVPAGTLLSTYTGHLGAVLAVAWSADSKYIASGSYVYLGNGRVSGKDKTVQVWDALTGKRLFTYTGHSDYVLAVAWSPDGKYIASGSLDKTVQVWKAP